MPGRMMGRPIEPIDGANVSEVLFYVDLREWTSQVGKYEHKGLNAI